MQSGSHLSRCLFYIDMNMVRAGVVTHPFEWAFGGAAELGGRPVPCMYSGRRSRSCSDSGAG
jgi:hypothetical protein